MSKQQNHGIPVKIDMNVLEDVLDLHKICWSKPERKASLFSAEARIAAERREDVRATPDQNVNYPFFEAWKNGNGYRHRAYGFSAWLYAEARAEKLT